MHDDADFAPVLGSASLPLRIRQGIREAGKRVRTLLKAIGQAIRTLGSTLGGRGLPDQARSRHTLVLSTSADTIVGRQVHDKLRSRVTAMPDVRFILRPVGD